MFVVRFSLRSFPCSWAARRPTSALCALVRLAPGIFWGGLFPLVTVGGRLFGFVHRTGE